MMKNGRERRAEDQASEQLENPHNPSVEIIPLENGRVMIRELDENGHLIRETFGMIPVSSDDDDLTDQPVDADDLFTDDEVKELLDNLMLPLIEEEPLINDVWTWESDLGSWIAAMEQAGIDKEKIVEVLKRHKEVNLSPQEATQIFREFTDGLDT
ncbi:hypothetical protein [Paenibacillus cremeus]|uniref:Uncharacterized protein n=1 Tax=Paenibacillus cremeus TaxID=2163881 RepID=A0A559JM88_9BACL|nr:hypothetical protein [Paenibacillus cremeus]TVY00992.1 hypothetical protein FPZ49_32895 [Paenibacillus cremeus]